jgi:hypothetical protein
MSNQPSDRVVALDSAWLRIVTVAPDTAAAPGFDRTRPRTTLTRSVLMQVEPQVVVFEHVQLPDQRKAAELTRLVGTVLSKLAPAPGGVLHGGVAAV